MRKRSIFIKLFGGFILVIISLVLIILFFSIRSIRGHYLDTLAYNLEKLGQTFMPQVRDYLETGANSDLDALVKDQGRRIETRITVVDQTGLVLADSDEAPESMVNHRYRPEIAEAFDGAVGRSLRFSNTVRSDMMYIGLPLRTDGEITHVLRLSLYARDIDSLLSRLIRMIWGIGLAIMLLALLAAFFLTRSLTRPLRDVSDAARLVATGDFSPKLSILRRDEFGELAGSFNHMTDRIQTLFAELSRQKDELDSIISSIDEGICVLDREGKILFTNAAFNEMLDAKDVRATFHWEAVRKQAFNDMIQDVLGTKESRSLEIEFGGRMIQCSAVFLEARDEVVVTCIDITRIKTIEAIKKDFVDNVSHELNTPLAAIKGYVETLEGEAGPEHRSYLGIIKRNTDRLIAIVQDLLSLSELEDKGLTPHVEDVDVKAILENVAKLYEEPIRQKGLTLALSVDDPLPPIQGDSFKLEQLLLNLIDNAVKYTEQGTISIRLSPEEQHVRIEFADTGIGIPEESLNRIFERFFVVDKSRSKKVGGTGLGLSIVKHIVQLHGGTIQVESRPGEGSTFIIRIPFERAAP